MRKTTSKVYKYVYRTSKFSNYFAFVFSLFVHIGIILFLMGYKKEDIKSKEILVTVIEEEKKEMKKRIKKEIEKKEIERKPVVRKKATLFNALKEALEKPPPVPEIKLSKKLEPPKINISKRLNIEPKPIVPVKGIEIKSAEVPEFQPQIDIKSYEVEERGFGGEIVIGKGVKTEEILKQPVYAPSIDITKGAKSSETEPGYFASRSLIKGGSKVRLDVGVKEESPPIPEMKKPIISKKPSKKKEKKIKVEISGTIAKRKIIQKVLPPYPSWAAERGVEATIILKVEVNPDGTVRRNIIVTGTSGYPNWDNLAKEYVLKWKFEPLNSRLNIIQSGYIILRFILE